MSIPDQSLLRRIAYLERRLESVELSLERSEMLSRRVTPLNSRLWVCQLNEDISQNEADADLLTLDNIDTLLDVTIEDILEVNGHLVTDDYTLCLEQLDIAGDRHFAIVGMQGNLKHGCHFTADVDFTTNDKTFPATIANEYDMPWGSDQFGQGAAHPSTVIKCYNMANSSGHYEYYGDAGDHGCAIYMGVDDHWAVYPFECP